MKLYTVIHTAYLRVVRKDDYFIDEEKYQFIRQCVFSSFPDEESDYNHCKTLEEWLQRVGCSREEIYVIKGDTWYLLMFRKFHRILFEQLVSSNQQCNGIFSIFSTVKSLFPNGRYREATTYQFIRFYERRGSIKVLKDETVINEDNGENYHVVIFKIETPPQQSKDNKRDL